MSRPRFEMARTHRLVDALTEPPKVGSMLEILTVCTGNICRSPLAELLLRARLGNLGVSVHSAGTRATQGARMTAEAQQLATNLGVPAAMADAHRARYLTERDLIAPHLLLAMSREHRRRIVELAPSRLRATFTVREFARLSSLATDGELRAVADSAGTDPASRVRAAMALIAEKRGLGGPLENPADDDVVDPYGRSWQTYEQSAAQLAPAIEQVVRVVDVSAP